MESSGGGGLKMKEDMAGAVAVERMADQMAVAGGSSQQPGKLDG